MIPLGQLFKSPVRMEVLRVLSDSDIPLGVRAVAAFARSHPYATSRILQELVAEGLIIKTGTKTRPTYRICLEHLETSRIQRVFAVDREITTHRHQADLSRKAHVFLDFNTQTLLRLRQAKNSRHAPV